MLGQAAREEEEENDNLKNDNSVHPCKMKKGFDELACLNWENYKSSHLLVSIPVEYINHFFWLNT